MMLNDFRIERFPQCFMGSLARANYARIIEIARGDYIIVRFLVVQTKQLGGDCLTVTI